MLAAFTAIAAITVTAAAFTGLTVLAFFRRAGANRNVGGRDRHHRVAGLVQAIDDGGVRGVKTVGLAANDRCDAALRAIATAVVATAATLTAFTATFSATTWLALALTARFLSGFVLALSVSFAMHGRSHGGLIGQCQILLYGIARNALATLAAVTALAAAALATDFAVLTARLLVASAFSAAFTTTLTDRTFLAFLTAALGACFRTALTAFSATALIAAVTASFGAAFTTAFTAATATATAITATALATV